MSHGNKPGTFPTRLFPALLLLPVLAGGPTPASAQEPPLAWGGGSMECECRVEIPESLARLIDQRGSRNGPRGGATIIPRCAFVPMGGVLNGDLGINNLVDLNATGGAVLDAFGGLATYDGHGGHDIDLISFDEQDRGVPVFAVLDGRVLASQDGEFDRRTAGTNVPANYVILDHGNNHQTYYWHLRKDSVAVTSGQTVKAGSMLGYAASSGWSTGPHLHFETRLDGRVAEPFTGSARPSASLWVQQPAFPAPTCIRRAFLTNENPATANFKEFIPRQAVWSVGSAVPKLILYAINGPRSGSNYSFRYVRPNGTVATTTGPGNWGSDSYRTSYWWFSSAVNFNMAGDWQLQFFLDGNIAFSLPVKVVTAGTAVPNRPPAALPIAMSRPVHHPDDVFVCAATAFDPMPDPDYDRVSYRWVWRKNGVVLRDLTHAGLADVLPRHSAIWSDTLTCEVTATDGTLTSPSHTVPVVIFQPYVSWATTWGPFAAAWETDLDGDGRPAVLEYWLGTSPQTADPPLLPRRETGTGQLSLHVPKAGHDPSIHLSVQTSTTLWNWASATPGSDGETWRAGSNADQTRYFRLRLAAGPAGPAVTVTIGEILPP